MAALVVVCSACGEPPEAAAPTPPAYPPAQWAAPPPPALATSSPVPAGAIPAAPPFAVPPRAPMPSAPLTVRGGGDWPRKDLPAPRRIGHGGVTTPGIPDPDRVAIARGKGGALLDARTGDVLASLPAPPGYVSARAGVVTLEGKPNRLLRLRDAQVITPVLDAGGKQLETSWLAASPQRPLALALAVTKDGEKLFALAGADLGTFRLAPAPLGMSLTRYHGVLDTFGAFHLAANQSLGAGSGTPFPMEHDADCVCAAVDDEGAVRCLEYLPARSIDRVRWMDGGWFVGGSFVSHVAWGGRRIEVAPLLGGRHCAARSTRDQPPRALFTCFDTRTAGVWTPEAMATFPAPTDPNVAGGLVAAESGPIIPVFDSSGAGPRPASRFVDLRTPRHWTTNPLTPLFIAPFAGIGRYALAEAPAASGREVVLVDFDAGTRETIARIGDCPGGLGELGRDAGAGDRWLVLACMTPEPPHTAARSVVWTEIVDLERRTRWRTPLLPEAFFPDGLLVLSARRALAAETKAAQSALYSTDLAALPR
ncbi:MAG: hypothetical protein WKG00_37610 [Polyangiaceae bacterium]